MTKPYFPTNSWIKPNDDGVTNVDMLAKAMCDFTDHVGSLTINKERKDLMRKSVLSLAEFINKNARKYRFCIVGGKYHTMYTPVEVEEDGTPLRKRTVLALNQEVRRGRYACNWQICKGDVGKTDEANITKTMARRRAYTKAGIAPNGVPMSTGNTYAPAIVSRDEKVNESPTRSSGGRKNKKPIEISDNTFLRVSSLSEEYCADETSCPVRQDLVETKQLEFNFNQATVTEKITHDIRNRYQ